MFIDGGYIRNVAIRHIMNRPDIAEDSILLASCIKLLGEATWETISNVAIMRILYYDAIIPADEDADKHKTMLKFFNDLRLKINILPNSTRASR